MPPEIRPDGTQVVTVRITLKPGRDDDLIALVQMAPRGRLASMVREAMRSGVTVRQASFETDEDTRPVDMTGLSVEL